MELVQYISLCLCVYLSINIFHKAVHSFGVRNNDQNPHGLFIDKHIFLFRQITLDFIVLLWLKPLT